MHKSSKDIPNQFEINTPDKNKSRDAIINKELKDSRNKKVQDICSELKSDVTVALVQLNT